jgi:hypothetical protein
MKWFNLFAGISYCLSSFIVYKLCFIQLELRLIMLFLWNFVTSSDDSKLNCLCVIIGFPYFYCSYADALGQ